MAGVNYTLSIKTKYKWIKYYNLKAKCGKIY